MQKSLVNTSHGATYLQTPHSYLNKSYKFTPPMPNLTRWLALQDWHLPFTYIAIVLFSALYTHHNYHQLLIDCSEKQLLQELVCMQIMGIVLATVAFSVMKRATTPDRVTYFKPEILTHPMLPPVAARRRQMLPLV